jgi:hypothetical protein
VGLRGNNVSERRTGAARRWFALALGSAATCVALGSAVAWAGHTYLGLVELEVAVSDAAARLEAARLGRAALVANLLDLANEGFGPEAAAGLDNVARLAARAEDVVLPRPVWRHPVEVEAVARAQHDLSAALAELPWLRPSERVPVDVASPPIDELAGRIERAEVLLDDAIRQLDSSVDRYERALATFPASILAGLAGRDAGESGADARSPG